MAIGEDSGLGTIELPLKTAGNSGKAPGGPALKAKTAEERLKALRAAGVDTSGLFALKGAAGEEMIIRMDGSGPSVVADDDPVFAAILASGTTPEKRLFRRWVTAQMFRLLRSPEGLYTEIRKRGPAYQWKMTLEELRVQARIAKNDPKGFEERNLWFNKRLIKKMAEHRLKLLRREQKTIAKLINGDCNTYGRKLVALSDEQMAHLKTLAGKIRHMNTPATLYRATRDFVAACPVFENESICPAWFDAYRGAGGYFTLKNLILFSGLHYKGLSGEKATKLLRTFASKRNGYEMYAEMLNTFEADGLDIDAKQKEWAKKKELELHQRVNAN